MRIIYKNTDNTVSVLVPAQEVLSALHNAGLNPFHAVAEKDVPQGLPYWIVEDSEVPADRTSRDQWVMDTIKDPDGFGGVSSEFTDAQLLELYNAGVIE